MERQESDGYSSIADDPLSGIEHAAEELEAAEQLVDESNRALRNELFALGARTPDAVRAEIVNEVYWRWPQLKPTDIAEAFGYKRLQGVLEPRYSDEHQCLDCGMPLLITSRSHLAQLARSRRQLEAQLERWPGYTAYDLLCPSCASRRKEERHREAEASWQRHRDRQRELATMPYREYLETPEWQARRTQHLRSARYRCQLCNSGERSLHVHHRTYENRGNERWSDLLVLCEDCHAKHHEKVVIE